MENNWTRKKQKAVDFHEILSLFAFYIDQKYLTKCDLKLTYSTMQHHVSSMRRQLSTAGHWIPEGADEFEQLKHHLLMYARLCFPLLCEHIM